jgi:hypothetical protein
VLSKITAAPKVSRAEGQGSPSKTPKAKFNTTFRKKYLVALLGGQGLVHVLIKHHPTIGDIVVVSNKYLKVMFKIQKGNIYRPLVASGAVVDEGKLRVLPPLDSGILPCGLYQVISLHVIIDRREQQQNQPPNVTTETVCIYLFTPYHIHIYHIINKQYIYIYTNKCDYSHTILIYIKKILYIRNIENKHNFHYFYIIFVSGAAVTPHFTTRQGSPPGCAKHASGPAAPTASTRR